MELFGNILFEERCLQALPGFLLWAQKYQECINRQNILDISSIFGLSKFDKSFVMKSIFYFLMALGLLSCGEKMSKEARLEKSDKLLALALDETVKSMSRSLFLYTDPAGREYIVFQNGFQNEICFYDFNTQELAFKIKPHFEGDNGVGSMFGFYVHNLDSIFLTSRGVERIFLIDTACVVKDKINYSKTTDGIPLRRTYSCTHYYHPIDKIGNKLYMISGCDRKRKENPISYTIDLDTREIEALPFQYLKLRTQINPGKTATEEDLFSRIYDGERFIYSFSYSEDVYIASVDHQTITKKTVKSRYLDEYVFSDDFGNVTFKDGCEKGEYGNLLYDKYRNVYYRIIYPKSDVPGNLTDREYIDLLSYGKKGFSIIILDKDLNVMGETLFPDYTYNSMMAFVHEDGLYLSASHAFNENYSDDWLNFQCFKLVQE